MTLAGTIYGVVLNDREELDRLATSFHEDPYKAPPLAPVVYIKPRMCVAESGTPVVLPAGEQELVVAATLGLVVGRDIRRASPAEAWQCIVGTRLALDVSVPAASYYRPPIAQRCRDGFLPLGPAGAPAIPADIATYLNDDEVHRWSLSRLFRSAERLLADLSSFMTLRAGDLLLVGVAGDAPRARAGQRIRIEADGQVPLEALVEEEAAS